MPTLMVGVNQRVPVEVACVEQGRWDDRDLHLRASDLRHPMLVGGAV